MRNRACNVHHHHHHHHNRHHHPRNFSFRKPHTSRPTISRCPSHRSRKKSSIAVYTCTSALPISPPCSDIREKELGAKRPLSRARLISTACYTRSAVILLVSRPRADVFATELLRVKRFTVYAGFLYFICFIPLLKFKASLLCCTLVL